MDLILALDIMGGLVVHGKSGNRSSYAPLDWGISKSAEPLIYIRVIRPRHLYIADLDRIGGQPGNDYQVMAVAHFVDSCFVDRGCRSPEDCLPLPGTIAVIGTETAGADLSGYQGGFLSVDIRDGLVLPSGVRPEEVLKEASGLDLEGCIILNLGAVGTGGGVSGPDLSRLRACYPGRLLYGGGVASEQDLDRIMDAGFDGAIVTTAVHSGAIPLDAVREGTWC